MTIVIAIILFRFIINTLIIILLYDYTLTVLYCRTSTMMRIVI